MILWMLYGIVLMFCCVGILIFLLLWVGSGFILLLIL